jgi:hypothetical protein
LHFRARIFLFSIVLQRKTHSPLRLFSLSLFFGFSLPCRYALPVFFIFLAKMPHLQQPLCVSGLRWHDGGKCGKNPLFLTFVVAKFVPFLLKFALLLATEVPFLPQRGGPFSQRSGTFKKCSTLWNNLFHPME